MNDAPIVRPPPEADISAHLRQHLVRLEGASRATWRPEVRLLAYTHACKARPNALRIDYVTCFDDGPLVGIEIKRRPDRPAELGRGLFQCAQYAMGQIAAAQAGSIPPAWIGKPLAAVFLRLDRRGLADQVAAHAAAAPRLYGPANVGFVTISKQNGLRLDIGGGRWWCERWGYRADATARTSRVGNGNFRPDAAT